MGNLDLAERAYREHVEPVPSFLEPWGRSVLRGRLSLARNNPEPLREAVVDLVANREEHYVPASAISTSFFLLGDYEAHMKWFAIRVKERNIVGWVMDDLRRRPDYREKLESWAQSDPDKAAERVQLVNEHLALLDRTTENMLL